MKTFLFILFLIFLAVILFMYVILFLRKAVQPKITVEEMRLLNAKTIIRNKEAFTKKSIQKAQQFIDSFEQKKSIAPTIDS